MKPTRHPISTGAKEESIETLFGVAIVKKEPEEKITVTITVESYRVGFEGRLKAWLKNGLRQHGMTVTQFGKVE